MEEQLSFFL